MTATQPDAKGPQPRVIQPTAQLRWLVALHPTMHPDTFWHNKPRLQQKWTGVEDGIDSWHDVPTEVETTDDAKGRANL